MMKDGDDIRTATPEEIRDMDQRGELHHNPDAPVFPVPEDFWDGARTVMPGRRNKASVHLRLDPDVLDWFRQQGPGYQTKINAVLRSYYKAHRDRTLE